MFVEIVELLKKEYTIFCIEGTTIRRKKYKSYKYFGFYDKEDEIATDRIQNLII